MRKLKFRAWDELNEKNHYSDEYKLLSEFWSMSEQHGWQVMQFTGLVDKYDKEIYEGDIIQCYHQIRIVEWGKPWAGLKHTMEIVGNIFENPKLTEAICKK